jgi:uncharacterized membrane-anchored protein YhcB (DUF1043 family)
MKKPVNAIMVLIIFLLITFSSCQMPGTSEGPSDGGGSGGGQDQDYEIIAVPLPGYIQVLKSNDDIYDELFNPENGTFKAVVNAYGPKIILSLGIYNNPLAYGVDEQAYEEIIGQTLAIRRSCSYRSARAMNEFIETVDSVTDAVNSVKELWDTAYSDVNGFINDATTAIHIVDKVTAAIEDIKQLPQALNAIFGSDCIVGGLADIFGDASLICNSFGPVGQLVGIATGILAMKCELDAIREQLEVIEAKIDELKIAMDAHFAIVNAKLDAINDNIFMVYEQMIQSDYFRTFNDMQNQYDLYVSAVNEQDLQRVFDWVSNNFYNTLYNYIYFAGLSYKEHMHQHRAPLLKNMRFEIWKEVETYTPATSGGSTTTIIEMPPKLSATVFDNLPYSSKKNSKAYNLLNMQIDDYNRDLPISNYDLAQIYRYLRFLFALNQYFYKGKELYAKNRSVAQTLMELKSGPASSPGNLKDGVEYALKNPERMNESFEVRDHIEGYNNQAITALINAHNEAGYDYISNMSSSTSNSCIHEYGFYCPATGYFYEGKVTITYYPTGGAVAGFSIDKEYKRYKYYIRVFYYDNEDINQTGTPVESQNLVHIKAFETEAVIAPVEAVIDEIDLKECFSDMGEQAMLMANIWLFLKSHYLAYAHMEDSF